LINRTFRDAYKERAAEHLAFIVPSGYEKNIGYDVEANPDKYIPCTIYMNSVLEEKGPALQTFSTSKHPNYECAMPYYIRYRMLSGFICRARGKKNKTPKKYQKISAGHMDEKIRHEKKEFRQNNYHFNYQIQTNSISVSVLFHKNGAPGKYENFAKAANKPKNAKEDTEMDAKKDAKKKRHVERQTLFLYR
jgi:hypothetical protein